MLRSELYELEKSVSAIIDDRINFNQDGYHQQITERVKFVKNLCSDLKQKWTHELLSNAKEQIIKRYVQYHQAGIVQLSDRVSTHLPGLKLPDDKGRFEALNMELEKVLEFLRSQFYQYFDIDHKASIYSCRLLYSEISEFAVELKNLNDEAVDKALIEAVFLSFHELAEEGAFFGASYRQLDQSLKVARMMHQLLLFGSKTTTDSLVRSLYLQNFNSLHFFNWFRDYLLKQTASIGDQKERAEFIHNRIKTLAAIFVSPEKAIQPELPSTDSYLLPWLEAQIAHGYKQQRSKPVLEQFPLNLSVPQFALFIRIFYKAGCFPIENVAMIIRFFSGHFTTKKQPHISHKSFGRAFYSLDQSAAAVVRDYLQKMLNYLNKTYFP